METFYLVWSNDELSDFAPGCVREYLKSCDTRKSVCRRHIFKMFHENGIYGFSIHIQLFELLTCLPINSKYLFDFQWFHVFAREQKKVIDEKLLF